MDLKLKVTFAIMALGLAVGCYEIFQLHWINAIIAISSGAITAGMFIFGKDFITQSYLGASLVIFVTLLGFYGLFFKSPALDHELYEARNEAAMTLLHASQICAGIPNSGELFIKASQTCVMQSHREQANWVSDASKQIYLRQELGLAEAVHNSLKKQEEDPCSSWVKIINEKCPDVFSSMKKDSLQRLLKNHI